MRWSLVVYRVLVILLGLGILAQLYLAGRGVFGAGPFTAHVRLGQAMLPVALLAFIVSWAARPVARPGATGLLLALLVLQPILATVPRSSAPGVAALHALVGGLALLAAYRLAGSVWSGFLGGTVA